MKILYFQGTKRQKRMSSSSSDESLNLEIIEEVTQDIWFQPQTTYEYEQLNHIDSPLIDEDNGEINEE